MAYASLLSVTQKLEKIMHLQSRGESISQFILHEEQLQMRSLYGTFSKLLSFLEDFSPKNSASNSCLEGKMRDVTCEAELLIESHIANQILSPGVKIEENYKGDLQIVIEKIDSILEEVEKMKEKNNRDEEEVVKLLTGNSSGASSLESGSTNKGSMVGFEDDMLRIKDLLTDSSNKLKTISIVGMGGIGKTTLARNIYNASFVNRHFDIRAWATVSQHYNVAALLVDLLKSMGNPGNGADVEELKLKLYKSLKCRRFLIIMDDVWDSKLSKEFRRIFPDDNNGSRIILTSRSSNMTYYSDDNCSHIHHLNFLSPEQSWTLLHQKALGKESCPRELEDIGKKIAENCKGLALALVVVGGILHKVKKTQAHWQYVAENVKYGEAGNYDNLMEILSWSYNQLPHHLRACFLYMGVFPEDYAVRVFHLIMLWVANGFIKPVSTQSLEQVAMEYLEDLITRNLIMVRERSYNGGEIKICVMHDLMREMCIRKAEEEKFLVVVDKVEKLPLGRSSSHLTLMTDLSESRRECGDVYYSTLRSFLCFGHGRLENITFKLLKVFDVCNRRFEKFPIELEELVNLRYIALVYKGFEQIPTSISKLHNLQILFVFNDTEIALQFEILMMPQLRHLWVQRGFMFSYSGGRNENLQTLRRVRNLRITEEALQMFPNLKMLGVSYDGWASNPCLENLVHLCQLEYLKLQMASAIESKFAFPVSLRKLSLSTVKLSSRKISMIGLLPDLEVMKLKYVTFKKKRGWKTNEGEFPKLKFLLLRFPSNFSWDLEGTHFPSLERLTLSSMYGIHCLPSEIGEIPNLKGYRLV